VEEVSEELPEVGIVWLVLKLQWPTKVQVCCKLTWKCRV